VIVKPIVDPVFGDGTDDSAKSEEAWRAHLSHNDSVIIHSFHGQLRSRCTCPQCHRTTLVFDPFVSLPLPLQQRAAQAAEVTFVPLDPSNPPHRIAVVLPPAPTPEDICRAVPTSCGRPVQAFLGAMSADFGFRWDLRIFVERSQRDEFFAFEIDDLLKLWVPFALALRTRNPKTGASERVTIAPFIVPVAGCRATEDDVAEAIEDRLEWLWDGGDRDDEDLKPARCELREQTIWPDASMPRRVKVEFNRNNTDGDPRWY
jgi:ubiquitin carboxyl-terminal hydrolase 4/11/15